MSKIENKVPEKIVDFQPDALEIKNQKLPKRIALGVWLPFITLTAAIVWACLAKTDVVVSGRGKLVTDSPIIVMKPLERSVVQKVHVKIGDVVEKDQVLITFDPTINTAEAERLKNEINALEAQLTRLQAEAEIQVLEDQLASSKAEAEQIERKIKVLENKPAKLRQTEAEILALEAQLAKLQTEAEILIREDQLPELKAKAEQLKNIILEQKNQPAGLRHTKAEMRALEAQLAKLHTEAEIRTLKDQLPKLKNEAERLKNKIMSQENRLPELKAEAERLKNEIPSQEAQLPELKDKARQLKNEIAARENKLAELKAEIHREGYCGGTEQFARWQLAIFKQRQEYYRERMKYFEETLSQISATKKAKEDNLKKQKERLDTFKKLEEMFEVLHKKHAASLKELLELSISRIEMEAAISQVDNELLELEHRRGSILAEKNSFVQEWRNSISENMVSVDRNLTSLRKEHDKAAQLIEYVYLRAPCNAVVHEVAPFSPGSAVREAETLITLVPLDGNLELEAEIPPENIGKVNVGAPVRIKLTAYPFQKHGTLDGVVRNISEDTLEKQEGGHGIKYYRARISVSGQLNNVKDNFRLIPGMEVQSEIKCDRRRVIEYILYPLIKAFDEAAREP